LILLNYIRTSSIFCRFVSVPVPDFEAELFLRILPLIALLPRDYAIRFTLVRGYVSFRM
jgi:hypothetical protein